MIPPKGFKSQLYPLRHRVMYAFSLGAVSDTQNTALCPLIMSSSDIVNPVDQVVVNPHNTLYESDNGPLVAKMSIIDKLNLSIKFNATHFWADRSHTSGQSTSELFSGDNIQSLKFLWRPIFFSFKEKLEAADDDTGTTVAAILALTHDATNKDVVPLTTNKLPTAGLSEFTHPISTVYDTQVLTDFNMTTSLAMEDHVWDEDLFLEALRRYTNKGALKACVGSTRHVTLSRDRPYKNFFINKFVPRSIRRVMEYTFMGIQVHLPLEFEIGQHFFTQNLTSGAGHLGCKIIANYHEWNSDHFQDMTGDGT